MTQATAGYIALIVGFIGCAICGYYVWRDEHHEG